MDWLKYLTTHAIGYFGYALFLSFIIAVGKYMEKLKRHSQSMYPIRSKSDQPYRAK